MKLNGLKLIFHHTYNFFNESTVLESFLSNIPFPKKETHISELNKIAIITIADDDFQMTLGITDKSIQLDLNSLDDIVFGMEIINGLQEDIKKLLRFEFIMFDCTLKVDDSGSNYNSSFNHAIPDKYQVKMLGVDIQSTHFEYKVSINKKTDLFFVKARALIESDLENILGKTGDAFKELEQEFKEFIMFVKG